MINLTVDNYNEEITIADKPILLFFTSKDCNYCDSVEKTLLEINSEKILIYKIKDCAKLVDKFNILSYPTILTFNKYKEPINKVIGFKGKEYLKLQIRQIMK